MGKTSATLHKYVKISPELKTDGKVLRCDLCDVVVNHTRKSNVTQHLETARHTGLVARGKRSLQQPFISEVAPKDQFAADLARTFLECDIPLHKMRLPPLVSFLQKYTKKSIPSETTIRGCIPALFSDFQEKLKDKFKNCKVWVSIDETVDSSKRCIVNLVAGILAPDSSSNVLC